MTNSDDELPAPYSDPIDYVYWASKPYWSVDEAAALMLDGNLADLKSSSNPKVLNSFGLAKRLIAQAQTQEELPRVIQPRIFKEWIETLSQQGLPPALDKAIVEFQEGASGVEYLRREIKRLSEENSALQVIVSATKSGTPRERETLLLMIYAMAVKYYRFNPKVLRQDAVKNIANTIRELDITISDDTIRSKLNDAASAFESRSRPKD